VVLHPQVERPMLPWPVGPLAAHDDERGRMASSHVAAFSLRGIEGSEQPVREDRDLAGGFTRV
jgi:hypothetical protein